MPMTVFAGHPGVSGLGTPLLHSLNPHCCSGTTIRRRIKHSVRADVSFTKDNRNCEHASSVVTGPIRQDNRTLSSQHWPQKSSLFLFRTDGMSCSRELVTGTGRFRFSHPSTQQHLLVWRDRPKVVMVIKKLGRELTQEFMEVVEYLSEAERMHVVVEPRMYDEAVAAGLCTDRLFTYTPQEATRLADFVDFVVCLGGDGVILHASSLFRRHIPPVVSFHLGSMGFLTNHPYPDFRKELRQVIYGYQKLATCSMDNNDLPPNSNNLGVMITLRMRLSCSIVRAGAQEPDQEYEVLNEIVVDRGSNSFLTNIEAYINGNFITRVQADGIMLATPTGSTAYSVAAGGSMVHPNVQAILLTPICPHSLNFRPIVLPDYIEMELRVPEASRVSAWVCFDGKQRQELHRGDSVFVRMSENPVPTINRADLTTDWFESLERCFRWSNRVEQKTFAEDWVTAEAQQQQQYRSNYYNRTGDADSESDSSASSTATQNGSSHSGGSNTSSDDCDKATSRQHSSTVSALASSLNGRPLHDDGPDLAMSGDLHGGLLEPSTPTAAGRSQAY